MRIRTQLAISVTVFGIVLLVISTLVITTNLQMERLNGQVEKARNIETEAGELGYLTNDFLLYREKAQIDRLRSKFSSFASAISELEVNTPEQRIVLGNIMANHQRLGNIFGEMIAAAENSAGEVRTSNSVLEFAQLSWSRIAVQNQGMISDASRLSGMLHDEAERLEQRNNMLIFILMGASAGFLLTSYFMLSRRTLRSVDKLREDMNIVGSGNLDYRLEERKGDEIGELTRAFNNMIKQLKAVTASKADLEREMAERRQAEEALSLERSKLEATIEDMDVGVVLASSEGAILSMNKKALELHDFGSKEEMFSRISQYAKEFDLHYPDGKFMPVEEWPMSRAMSGHFVSDYEVRLKHPAKNSSKVVSYSVVPVKSSAGDVIFFVISILDMTERKENEEAMKKLNAELEKRAAEVQAANEKLRDSHRAALNVMEDAIRARDALRESENQLKRAQEIARLGSWELDIANNRLNWSDEVYRIFGLRPQEFQATYEAFLDAVHPEDRKAVDSAYAGSLRKGTDSYEIEHRIIRKSDGQVRIVHEKCEHIRDESGKIVKSVGMVHDITEMRQADESLRQSQRDLKHAQAVAQTGSWKVDVKTDRRFWSDETHKIFGVSPETSLTNEVFLSAVHPDDRSYVERKWNAALRGEHYDLEYRVVANGKTKWVHDKGELDLDGEGNVQSIFGTTQDITTQKQYEKTLEDIMKQLKEKSDIIEGMAFDINQERDLLKVIMENTEAHLAYLDRNFNFINVNSTYAQGTGYAEKDLIGRNHFRIFPDAENEAIFKKARDTGKVIQFKAKPFVFKDQPGRGVTYWNWTLTPVKDKSGKVIGLVLSLFDVTENVKARQSVENSLKEREILLKEIHHRVKNNLQLISSLVRLQAAAGKPLQDMQGRIRSIALVHEILYQTKDFNYINAKEYFKRLTDEIIRMHGSKSIELVLDSEELPFEVNTMVPCGLIMNELVMNSLKHAFDGKGGRIRVGVHSAGSDIELVVEDDGKGIPESFDPAAADTLGMQLVMSLADQLDGKVAISREKGTKVMVSFPRKLKIGQ